MVSLAASLANLRQHAQATAKGTKEAARRASAFIARPPKLQKAADGATRMGQVIALLLLGPVIMVSLALVRVINDLMTQVLLGQDLSGQDAILGWLVTFLTLCILAIAAWGWFQFVRTAGFGGFSFD